MESVANRDYPELDLKKIGRIFVPEVFLAKYPKALDYEKYIEELKNIRETLDLELARSLLRKIEKCKKEEDTHPDFSAEERDILDR